MAAKKLGKRKDKGRILAAAAMYCALMPGWSLAAAQQATDPLKAEQAYLHGARLLSQQDLSGAQTDFERAARLNPTRNEYALAVTLTKDHRVNELVQEAAKAHLMGDTKQAEVLLGQAKAVDPTNEQVLERLASSTHQFTSLSTPLETLTPGGDPRLLGLVALKPTDGLRDLDFRGGAEQVVSQVAQQYGVRAIWDQNGEASPGPEMHFRLEQVTYRQAMSPLLKMAHLFAVPVDAQQILIAKDTQENRLRLERQLEESIYVPGSTSEELNEFTNIIKNVFDVRQISIGLASGTLLLRAPEPTLRAVNAMLEDLIQGASEVILDIRLIAVEKSTTVNTGTQTPTSLGAFSAYGEAQAIVSANSGLVQQLISSGGYVPTGNVRTDTLLEALYLVLSGAVQDAKLTGLVALVGNGLTLTGIYLGSGATINFGLSSSDTRILDAISLRVGDRQSATLKIGEKYPITTATYSSGLSSATKSALAGVTINGVSASSLLNQSLGANSAATIPQVQFEDLGITLKLIPAVLKSGMVNMKVDLKIEALTGASSDGIPILTSRIFTSDLTVEDGMSAVMLSEVSQTEAASIQGIPGLGDLPGLRETAADRLKTTDKAELVLLVTPHVVRHRPNLTASQRFPFQSTVPADF